MGMFDTMGMLDKMKLAAIDAGFELYKKFLTQEEKEDFRLAEIFSRWRMFVVNLQKRPENLSMEDQLLWDDTIAKPALDSFVEEVSPQDMEAILARLPEWRKAQRAGSDPWTSMKFEEFYRNQYLPKKNSTIEK